MYARTSPYLLKLVNNFKEEFNEALFKTAGYQSIIFYIINWYDAVWYDVTGKDDYKLLDVLQDLITKMLTFVVTMNITDAIPAELRMYYSSKVKYVDAL